MLSLRIKYVVSKGHRHGILAIEPEGTSSVWSKPKQESNYQKSLKIPGKLRKVYL